MDVARPLVGLGINDLTCQRGSADDHLLASSRLVVSFIGPAIPTSVLGPRARPHIPPELTQLRALELRPLARQHGGRRACRLGGLSPVCPEAMPPGLAGCGRRCARRPSKTQSRGPVSAPFLGAARAPLRRRSCAAPALLGRPDRCPSGALRAPPASWRPSARSEQRASATRAPIGRAPLERPTRAPVGLPLGPRSASSMPGATPAGRTGRRMRGWAEQGEKNGRRP